MAHDRYHGNASSLLWPRLVLSLLLGPLPSNAQKHAGPSLDLPFQPLHLPCFNVRDILDRILLRHPRGTLQLPTRAQPSAAIGKPKKQGWARSSTEDAAAEASRKSRLEIPSSITADGRHHD